MPPESKKVLKILDRNQRHSQKQNAKKHKIRAMYIFCFVFDNLLIRHYIFLILPRIFLWDSYFFFYFNASVLIIDIISSLF